MSLNDFRLNYEIHSFQTIPIIKLEELIKQQSDDEDKFNQNGKIFAYCLTRSTNNSWFIEILKTGKGLLENNESDIFSENLEGIIKKEFEEKEENLKKKNSKNEDDGEELEENEKEKEDS